MGIKRVVAKAVAEEMVNGKGPDARTVKVLESIGEGWKALGPNLWPLLGLAAAYALATGLGAVTHGLISIVATLAQWILMGVTLLVSIHIMRREGAKLESFGDLPLEGSRVLNYLLVTLVTTLIFVGGLILLIVPGIYWALKYSFAPAYALEEGVDLGESLRRSAALTEGVKWQLLGQGFVFFGVILLGCLALLVGVVPAAMCVCLAWSWTYIDLRRQAGDV